MAVHLNTATSSSSLHVHPIRRNDSRARDEEKKGEQDEDDLESKASERKASRQAKLSRFSASRCRTSLTNVLVSEYKHEIQGTLMSAHCPYGMRVKETSSSSKLPLGSSSKSEDTSLLSSKLTLSLHGVANQQWQTCKLFPGVDVSGRSRGVHKWLFTLPQVHMYPFKVAFGLVRREASLYKEVGSEGLGWGLRGDGFLTFYDSVSGQMVASEMPYCNPLTEKDEVVMVLNLDANVLSFSINGKDLPPAFGPEGSGALVESSTSTSTTRLGDWSPSSFGILYPAVSLFQTNVLVTVQPLGFLSTLPLRTKRHVISELMRLQGLKERDGTTSSLGLSSESKTGKHQLRGLFSVLSQTLTVSFPVDVLKSLAFITSKMSSTFIASLPSLPIENQLKPFLMMPSLSGGLSLQHDPLEAGQGPN